MHRLYIGLLLRNTLLHLNMHFHLQIINIIFSSPVLRWSARINATDRQYNPSNTTHRPQLFQRCANISDVDTTSWVIFLNTVALQILHVAGINTPQQTSNVFITFVQCRPNVFDVGPTLYKCYTNIQFLLGPFKVPLSVRPTRSTMTVFTWPSITPANYSSSKLTIWQARA